MLSTTGNLTVCWTSPHDDPPDGYYITSHPHIYPIPASLWMNQSSPGVYWVNQSMCANFGRFTPGQMYEIGVVSVKGNDRSETVSIKHATGRRNKLKAALKGQGRCRCSILFFPLCMCRSTASPGSNTSFSGPKLCTAVHPASTAGSD